MNNNVVNRICPKCGSPNYVIGLEGHSVLFKYKCMNCYTYFNDDEDMKSVKVYEPDRVNVVRCKDCKWHYETTRCHYYKAYYEDYDDPSEAKPSDNFYCADGVKRDG